jgi:hypothetical protein
MPRGDFLKKSPRGKITILNSIEFILNKIRCRPSNVKRIKSNLPLSYTTFFLPFHISPPHQLRLLNNKSKLFSPKDL